MLKINIFKRNIDKIWLYICILFTYLFIQNANGYNLDLPSYIRHTHERGSMFGFSIALHTTSNSNHKTNWVFVGAPRGDTSNYQPGVEKAGAVYRCDIQDDNRCSMVPFDSKGNQFNDRGEQIDTKSNQWLGATVASSGENGVIVACAPHYIFHTMQPKRVQRNEPVGTCFTFTNFTSFTEFSPCRTAFWGYHRQGSCQAGFSAALSKKGDRLFIGAPGSWYWQGQGYSINPEAKYPYKPPMYQDFGEGQTYSHDVTDPKSKVYSTGESYSTDDDSYLGYSMITGDFDGDGSEDVAIGMPRGAELLGKIVINKWNMVNILNITGWQIGAYFGYSLATVDVNGDKLDDLIIGAPMYSEPNNEGKYEVGRVYIMMQGRNENFLREETRDGISSRGRFGLALSTLGDINQDGYGDFAVGAPYDGPNGRGAVYIYHGSSNGPLAKPSQVILAEDIVGTTYPRTFGFSLSGGVDMDGNMYPDLAVGAYDSDSVIIFKSRPVAVVDATTTFASSSKLINLDDKRCTTYLDGRSVTCTEVKSCLKYNGKNLPLILDFQVSWVLDAKKTKNPRMFFLLDQGKNIRNSTIRMERGKTLCRNETVYLVDNIRDKLTPLEVEMRYQLRNTRTAPLVRRKRDALEPVIDQNRDIVQRDSMNIQKNCGVDNVCIPDLRLQIQSVDKFLLGSKDPLYIDVLISNFGEDAFEAGFYMTLPKDLDFKKIQQSDAPDTPITCTAPTKATNYTLKCDIGNPLPAGKVAKFKVVMIPSQKVGMAPSYDFYMEANSTNHEMEGSSFDNIIEKSIGIWVETDLAIKGKSVPSFEHYKASDYKEIVDAKKEGDLGPHVVHIYNIRNNGPSNIEEAVVYIHYPYQTQSNDTLMYLLNQPETEGNVYCDPITNVNPLDLELDNSLAKRSYLESIGAVVVASGSRSSSHVEQSGSGVSSHTFGSSSSSNRVLTEAEIKKLREEESIESTGDASLTNSQRANVATSSSFTSGGSAGNSGVGNGRQTYVSSNSFSSGGSRPSMESSYNRTIVYDSFGNPKVFESSTEYYRPVSPAPLYESRNVEYTSQGSGRGRQYQNENGGNILLAGAGRSGNRGGVTSQASSSSHVTANNSDNYNRNYDNSHIQGGRADNSYRRNFNDITPTSSLDKVAQGGHGFRAGTLDLETLGRDNVDEEVRHRATNGYYNNRGGASSSSSADGSQYSHRTGGGYTAIPSSGTQYGGYGGSTGGAMHSEYSSSHNSNKNNGETFEDEDGYYYDSDLDNTHNNKFSTPASSHHQLHNFGDQSHIQKNRDYIRGKRQVEIQQNAFSSPCKATKCEALRCVVKNLDNNDGAWIAIRTRLVAKTMEKLASNIALNVSTMAISHVTRLPYIGAPKDDIIRSHEIFYKAVPEPIPVPDVVPMWVVVLSAVAGAIILLLLVFLLYKCGFFKRNRPSDNSQEKQPLRNGDHGDEYHL